MNAADRRPDWRSPDFWAWSIASCEARPKVLVRWFPEVGIAAWQSRKQYASTTLGVDFPDLDRRNDVVHPAEPPKGWPMRAEAAGVPSEAPRRDYKESIELLSDGSYKSDKLLEMSAEQVKDERYLLEAHGFDPAEWEIVSAKNNIWNVYSKGEDGHDISTLYSSRITVKPCGARWELSDLLTAFRDGCAVVCCDVPARGEMLLELGFTDTHFGNSTLDTYRDTIARSVALIRSRSWHRIVIWTGSDFFHCDNFKNTTANGTLQSSVWWPDAYRDGLAFIDAIVTPALECGVEVYVYYIPGNHDESMSWMFANLLRERYPQAVHDTDILERKVHVFGECAIGMTHGDEKTRRDLDRVFGAESREFASALHREVHMGHLHHESTKDNYGTVSRSLPTRARTDKWHREEGFVGARKRFQAFEWDANEGVTDIHYV